MSGGQAVVVTQSTFPLPPIITSVNPGNITVDVALRLVENHRLLNICLEVSYVRTVF